MEKKIYTRGQKIKFTLFTLAFFSLLIMALGEIVTKAMAPIESSIYIDKNEEHKTLGWASPANLSSSYSVAHYQTDDFYPVKYSTVKDGFRSFGSLTSDKPKVLFVGDSFTQSVEVRDDRTFYHLLGDSLDLEVFAYGQAGYGNLQELMIVQQYFDVIKPDLVLFQVCDNDFIDNHPPMEKNSLYKVGRKRPYLNANGEIYSHSTKPAWKTTVDKSKFLALLRKKIETSISPKDVVTTQKRMSKEGRNFKAYDESIKITSEILRRLKTAVGDTPTIVWSASPYSKPNDFYKEMCVEHDLIFTSSPAYHVKKKREQQIIVNSSDGYHWNELGQSVVAKSLSKHISSALSLSSK